MSLTSSTNEIESFLGEQASHQRRLQALNTTSSEYDLHIQVTESAFTETVLGASPGAESTAVIFSAGASVELIDSSIVATTKDAQKVEKMPTLIYMASGFLTLKNNCFVGNDAGITPVIAQQSSVEANSNFHQRASNNLPNTGCEFIAHNVMTDADNLNKGFVCEASDAPVCTSKRPVNYRYPCVSYLDEIYFTESDITDPSIPRTYLLCPNTVFRVGSRHTDEGTPVGGSYPIILGRSNIRVLCGIDGKFGNNCLIRNGVVQVAHFDEFQTGGIPINNALVQGISFSSASSINALISGKGDVVFRDCAFTNNDNVASVYVQNIEPRVRGRRNLEATINHVVENAQRRTQSQSAGSNLLEATLDSCIFEVSLIDVEHNSFRMIFVTETNAEHLTTPHLVCIFQQNNTIGSALNPVSGLITSYEASLTIADSMIIDTINHATPVSSFFCLLWFALLRLQCYSLRKIMQDYLGYYEVGYLVGNFGGAMKLAKNCFFDNSVTIAPVLNRGSLTAMFNAGRQQLAPSNQSTSELMTERSAKNPGELLYGINDTMTESTNTTWDPPIDHNLARCEFIANIPDNVLGEVNPELITFSCEGFDAEECSHESAPTNAPTLSPTVSPQPSAQPSMQPTMEPSVSLPLTSPEIGIDAAVESSGYRISPSLSVLCFVVFSAYSYMS